MNFDYQTESIHTSALTLDYFLVPWDTAIVGRPVAEISRLEVNDPVEAAQDFRAFTRWSEEEDITLCSCRLSHERLNESMFLEAHGFRFVELNYRPRLTGLQTLDLPMDKLKIEPAGEQDRGFLTEMAAGAFRYGRFHQDPRLGPMLGNRRYRVWMINSFSHQRQKVLKCLRDSEIVGFFVVEYPEPRHCFWSLVGLVPGLQGQGLSKQVWKTLLRWHQREGIDTITTSISSHNVVVFNFYVSLGFRFPAPQVTLHWRPSEALPLN